MHSFCIVIQLCIFKYFCPSLFRCFKFGTLNKLSFYDFVKVFHQCIIIRVSFSTDTRNSTIPFECGLKTTACILRPLVCMNNLSYFRMFFLISLYKSVYHERIFHTCTHGPTNHFIYTAGCCQY